LKQSGSELTVCTLQPCVSPSKAGCDLAVLLRLDGQGQEVNWHKYFGVEKKVVVAGWICGLASGDFSHFQFFGLLSLGCFWCYLPFCGYHTAVLSLSIHKRRLNILLSQIIFFNIYSTFVINM